MHNHSHNHDGHNHGVVKNIKTAFFLNLSFTIIEFFGGIMTNSVAIMSDALHDLGDSFSLGLAWFLEKKSHKKANETFSYGYKRLSLLGAFINATILFVGSIFILTQAIPRLISPEVTDAKGMLMLAILGMVVNGAAVLKTSSGKNMNERVISLHMLEDVLGWVAVFIVSLVMLFVDLPILDPILSILITLYILWGVVKNLKTTVMLFLQTTPAEISIKKVTERLFEEKLVVNLHDTHVWSLDGESHIFSGHITVKEKTTKPQLKKLKQDLKQTLKNFGINHATIEFEYEGEICEGGC